MTPVEKGARLLDVRHTGWASKVNLEKLDMHSIDTDVLAQLYGDYIVGLATLGIEGRDIEYGHDLNPTQSEFDESWLALTEDWTLEIGKRLYR